MLALLAVAQTTVIMAQYAAPAATTSNQPRMRAGPLSARGVGLVWTVLAVAACRYLTTMVMFMAGWTVQAIWYVPGVVKVT